jgi:hypothetical protein
LRFAGLTGHHAGSTGHRAFLQAWLPHQFPSFAMLDLPVGDDLFAISRRNRFGY